MAADINTKPNLDKPIPFTNKYFWYVHITKPSPLLWRQALKMVGKINATENWKNIIVNAGNGGHLVNGRVALTFFKVAIQLALNRHSMKIVVMRSQIAASAYGVCPQKP